MSITDAPRNQHVARRRDWTDLEDKLVREKLALGWTAGQIADALQGRTRNAVIGYIDRTGLKSSTKNTNQHSRNVEPAAPYERKPRSETRKPHSERPSVKASMSAQPERRIRDKASYPKPQPADISRFDTPADSAGISLLELTNATCRWPKGTPGEPGFTFCGHTTADMRADRPYCAEHTRRARA